MRRDGWEPRSCNRKELSRYQRTSEWRPRCIPSILGTFLERILRGLCRSRAIRKREVSRYSRCATTRLSTGCDWMIYSRFIFLRQETKDFWLESLVEISEKISRRRKGASFDFVDSCRSSGSWNKKRSREKSASESSNVESGRSPLSSIARGTDDNFLFSH